MFSSTQLGALTACIAVGLLLVSGCFADPFPEPDPSPFDNEEADEDDEDGDQDTDDFDDDDDTEGAPRPPRIEKLFSSAPSQETGAVTVVGLTECVVDGMVVRVRGQNSQQIDLPVFRDGSFAGRVPASEREDLYFVTVDGDGRESEPVLVPAGIIEGEPIGNGIMGTGQIFPPDTESQVAVQGNGDRLTSGDAVIGGNIDQSTGVSTLVSNGEFDLFIPGQPRELIDLFLVRSGEHSGYSDPQTVTVP